MYEKPTDQTSPQSTSFPVDSPAKISQIAKDLASRVLAAAYDSRCFESSANLGHDASSLKTSQDCPPKGSIPFSPALPRAGLMRSGSLYELSSLVRPTVDPGSGLWPTPTETDESLSRRHGYTINGHSGTTLTDAVLIHLGLMRHRKPGERIPAPAGPAPAFSGALMGFPPGWTDTSLQPTETR